jgi:hypothetical protein
MVKIMKFAPNVIIMAPSPYRNLVLQMPHHSNGATIVALLLLRHTLLFWTEFTYLEMGFS